jgi:tetratricopeptide (TPR) repeat protein
MVGELVSINLRLLLWSLLILLLVGGLVHAVHAVQWKRNSAALLAMAENAEEEGDTERAIRFLGQYVVRVPSDAETMARFGFLLDDPHQSPASRWRARKVFEQVLIRDASRADVRYHLALLDVAMGDMDAARPHLELLLQNDPENAELAFNLGLCFEARREFASAAKWYEQSKTADPMRVASYARLAMLQRDSLHKGDDADATVAEMVDTNCTMWQAFVARAQFLLGQRFLDPAAKERAVTTAKEDITQALELAPEEPTVLFAAADFELKIGKDFERARACLQKVLEKNDRLPIVYEYLANVERAAQKPEKVLDVLRQGLKKVRRPAVLMWSLTYELIQRGELGEASRQLDDLAKMDADLERGRLDFLRGALQLGQGSLDLAAYTLESARPFFSNQDQLTIQTDYLLAQCYEKLGRQQDSFLALRRVLALDPLQVRARRMIAADLMRRDQLEDALNEYQQLLDQEDPPASVWVPAMQLMIAQTLGVPKEQRSWDRVDKLLSKVSAAHPDTVDVILVTTRILVAKNQQEEARKLLDAARKRKPDEIELWLARAELEQHLGNHDATAAILTETEKRLGDSVPLRLARLNLTLSGSKPPDVPFLHQLEEGVEKFEKDDRARLLGALGNAARDLKDLSEARRLWGLVAAIRPKDMGIRFVLLEAALQQNDGKGADEVLESIKALDAASQPMAQYAHARVLIWDAEVCKKAEPDYKSKLTEAEQLLTRVERQLPRWSRVAVARGQIHELQGLGDLAASDFRQAIEWGERDLNIVRRVLQLLYERGDYQQADLVLRQLPAHLIISANLQQMAVETSLQIGDGGRAAELARRAIPDDSKNFRDYIWLGQVLWAAEKPREAEAALRNAITLAPDMPDVWIALVQFLSRINRAADAQGIIEKDVSRLPKDQATLTRARCYAALYRPGDPSRRIFAEVAGKAFLEALKIKPKDLATLQSAGEFYLGANQHAQAEECYRTILAMEAKEPLAAGRARRALGLLLVAGPERTYQRTREALVLLKEACGNKEKAANDSEAVMDRRAMAMVLATSTSPDENRSAAKILKELDQRPPLSANDRFLLAQLYNRLGMIREFDEEIARLLRENPGDVRYPIYYVSALLQRDDPKSLTLAETLLHSAERLAGEDAAVVELEVRLDAKNKEQDKASNFLRAWATRQKDPAVAGKVALLFEQIGELAAAEEYFRQYANQPGKPEAILALASFLGRQGRVNEALDYCDKAWATCPSDSVAATSMAVLKSPKAQPEHMERVQVRLERALRKENRPGLVMCLGGLAEQRGRYDDAEKIYRQVLQAEPGNAAALNNLAWALVQRHGNLDEALALVSRAFNLLGPVPQVLDTRAVVYLAQGQTKLAIADLVEVCEQPGVSISTKRSACFHLAQAYKQNGNADLARSALAKGKTVGLTAEQLAPTERQAYTKLTSDLRLTP